MPPSSRPSRRALLALGGGAFAAQALGAGAAGADAPGLLIFGGPIYTGAPSAGPGGGGTVEALAVLGDRIVFAGTLDEARRAAPGARPVDLAGATALPGFADSHVHLSGVGFREMTLDLTGVGSVGELQARLGAWARSQPAGVITGAGWIETHWPEHRFPTRADLDAVVADRPVYLQRADGHAGVANTRMIELAGITASTADPAGGEILREAGGHPAGLFVDNAQRLIRDHLPRPDAAATKAALTRADRLYRSRGWTAGHYMSVDADGIAGVRSLAAERSLKLRVYAYMDPSAAAEVLAGGPSSDPTGRVRVRGIKLYADGALGSRGAALLAPYSDKPESTGLLVTPHDRMVELMAKAKAVGAQVAVHAIGDRGNRLTLDAMAEVLGAAHTNRRWRIEHAQILSLQDLPRFAAMGVIASMQPSHAIGDLYFAPARLGDERLRGAYAWRSLIESGAVVCAGTDAPVEKGDPLIEFYAAVYRHALNGFSAPDWGLNETVSRAQALHMLTAAPAYAVGREADLGTLETGKLADISVFSKDLMTVAPPEILKARAVMTIIGGEVVYQG